MKKLLFLCLLSLAGLSLPARAQTFIAYYCTSASCSPTVSPLSVAAANNSTYTLTWTVTGSVTCAATVDSSSDGVSYTTGGVIASQNCATSGTSTATTSPNWVRLTQAITGTGSVRFVLQGGAAATSGGTVNAGTGMNGGGALPGPITLNLNAALPSGETATTQSALDNSTKVGTTGYSDAAVAVEKSRAQTAEALIGPSQTPYIAPQPINGCGVEWTGLLTFTVGACSYSINGVTYNSPLSNLTLPTPDATNPEIDVIYVDATQTVQVLQGTPAPSPVQPTTDPSTQLPLTFVTVAANATTPTNTVLVDIYHTGNNNWTTAVGGTNSARVSCTSTNFPYDTTQDCEFGIGGTVASTTYAQFTMPASGTVNLGTYNNLVMYVRNKAAWASTRSLTLQWYSGATAKGTALVLANGTLGFNALTNTSSYQQITIPLSLFQLSGNPVGVLRVTVSGSGTAPTGFYLDDITLQGGSTSTVLPTSLMNFVGAWNNTTAYQPNNVVTSGGNSYVALVPNTNVAVSTTSTWAALDPVGDGNAAHFLNGTGAYSTPASGALTATYPNDTTTGTTVNLLAKSSGGNAINLTTSDVGPTVRYIGICASGCGTSGNATIQYEGRVQCSFDGSTTAGDVAVVSSTAAGKCSDNLGSSVNDCSVKRALGIIVDTGTGAGLRNIDLDPLQVGCKNAFNSGGDGTYYFPLAYPNSGNANDSGHQFLQSNFGITGIGANADLEVNSAGGKGGMRMLSPRASGYSYLQQCSDSGAGTACGNTNNDLFIDTVANGWTGHDMTRFNGGTYTIPKALGSISGTNNIDNGKSNVYTFTMTGATTITISGNQNAGQLLTLIACQDATGGRALTLPANFKHAPTVTSAASDCTAMSFAYDGTNYNSLLPTQYTKLRCSPGLGDGVNAITAATYPQYSCVNTSSVPWTITGISCYTDNAGTSTLSATNNAGTALLTGAITCNSTKASGGAAGTLGTTVTLAAGDAINFSFVADGTTKQTNWAVSLTQ